MADRTPIAESEHGGDSNSKATKERDPLSWQLMTITAIAGLAIAAGATWLMWRWVNSTPWSGEQKSSAHLEVLKISASIVVMLGGICALYLTARRQRTQEKELKQREKTQQHTEQVAEENRLHGERVATATENDAARRRVIELYAKAAEQLGSPKAAVRLAGMYALDLLGRDNPDQRRTVLDLICAYLRMPFQAPDPREIREISNKAASQSYWDRVQESEVRVAAQRILALHLNPGDDGSPEEPTNVDYWPQLFTLDLTGATLINLDMHGCKIGSISFRNAHFLGETTFSRATFDGYSPFVEARFSRHKETGSAIFSEVDFKAGGAFTLAKFEVITNFVETRFGNYASFRGSQFDDYCTFNGTKFESVAEFSACQFRRAANFFQATFNDAAPFSQTVFTEGADFSEVDNPQFISLTGAMIQTTGEAGRMKCVWPEGWKEGTFQIHQGSELLTAGLIPTQITK